MSAESGAGIVLCGGQSLRMGTSKAMLDFGGETMLQRVVSRLGSVVSPIIVVASPDQVLPPLPASVPVIHDERPGLGPLEGLRTGMKALPATIDAAYVTSCDVPLLVPAFVGRLFELAAGFEIAVVEHDRRPHPLSAVYRRSVLERIDALLAVDNRRLRSLLDAARTRRVPPSDLEGVDPQLLTLRNLNCLADYRDALAVAGLDGGGAPRS